MTSQCKRCQQIRRIICLENHSKRFEVSWHISYIALSFDINAYSNIFVNMLPRDVWVYCIHAGFWMCTRSNHSRISNINTRKRNSILTRKSESRFCRCYRRILSESDRDVAGSLGLDYRAWTRLKNIFVVLGLLVPGYILYIWSWEYIFRTA